MDESEAGSVAMTGTLPHRERNGQPRDHLTLAAGRTKNEPCRLFRADSLTKDRTELLVMVTPYVVADHEEGWELTRQVREQLGLHTEIEP